MARSPTPRPISFRTLVVPLEGILTLESGNIQIFTDRDVLVAHSRIMTERAGSILTLESLERQPLRRRGRLETFSVGAAAEVQLRCRPPLQRRHQGRSRCPRIPTTIRRSVIIVEVIGYGGSGGGSRISRRRSPKQER